MIVTACSSKDGSSGQPSGAGAGNTTGAGAGNTTGAGAGGTCASGLAACGGSCVDVASNPSHCGQCDNACSGGQVCDNGSCTGLPAMCPCPVESYCDLSTNSCKVGCTDDSQCSAGRICDTDARTCHEGCRADAACGPGKICENMLCQVGCRADGDCGSGQICDNNACRPGCRTDGACPSGQVCDATTLTCRMGCTSNAQCQKETICTSKSCVSGCDTDARCNTGRICTGGMCVDGCHTDSSCPMGQYCNLGTMKCVAGCNNNAARCAVGQACVPLTNGGSTCQAACYGYDCNGANWECFSTGSNFSKAQCRQTCSTNADCPNGETCTWFTGDPSVPQDFPVQLCAKPCSVAGCGAAIDSYAMTGNCSCASNGTCMWGNNTYTCYEVDPNYGL